MPSKQVAASLRVGIDIGGTFTDLVLADKSGVIATHKILTSPSDPVAAIVAGLDAMLNGHETAARVGEVVHGTTLVTNALIEQKGVPTALFTTKGFRDVIEIGREWRYDMYDIFLDPPPSLVPRTLRYEVDERSNARGEILTATSAENVADVVAGLPKDVKSVAVCFLHSYANPKNEQAARAAIAKARPDLAISLSSDVAPEIREFERLSTTIANAYVQPLVKPYLTALQERLKEAGVPGRLYILLSNGGLATADNAARFPVRIVESGPAAGAIGAASLGKQIKQDRTLAFDMGGTTAKICFIDDGEPTIAREFEVARAYRFKPGSGIPLKVPAIELLEIGAGGGSIARTDAMRRLRVGPDSAGAKPGPVAYGQGGTEPTVTDADLALGYLDADYFLGGRMTLDLAGARRAIETKLAKPLDLSVQDAAWGIHQIVNENMANALRIHAAERGKDVRSYGMVAFGGAGGVHACRIAEAMHMTRVVSPFAGSVLSAVGMLSAPLAFDFVRTSRQFLDEANWKLVNELFAQMETEGKAMLGAAGVKPSEIEFERSCEMRFVGQGYELEVALPVGKLDKKTQGLAVDRFSALYRKLYSRLPTDVRFEVLNWRIRVSGKAPKTGLSGALTKVAAARPDGRKRQVYFPETGLTNTRVHDRYRLKPGDKIIGPAVVEQIDTTFVVPPGWRGKVDASLSILLERKA
jgi:N-methylhydantoinase A